MRYVIITFFILFYFSLAADIGIKNPTLKNLPAKYKPVFLNFFLDSFYNTEKYSKKKSYKYTIKPIISSVAGTYNFCLDIYEQERLKRVYCFSATDGEDLSDRLLEIHKKIDFLEPKKEIRKKYLYLKILAVSKRFESLLKVVSHNGDLLVSYKRAQPFSEKYPEHLTVANAVINIDTVILNDTEATKLLDYLLDGYRFKGILIIKTY